MARRGVFGRLPRAAPDLTNTLVALIREANAQEDSNYVDAWKNGGKVEGHGVDDQKLLEHFRKRRDALSPDDPLWDEWNNRVAQYDFSINESKMSLKFDQKKVTEQQVSDFYKKWVNRPEIQADSEFYRHLLSQQAKWHQAAIQGNAARGASHAYENHLKWVAGVEKRDTNPAKDAHNYILQIAVANGAAPDGANSLQDVYETSAAWGRVLDTIDNGKSDDPAIQKMMDEATKLIRATPGNEDFVFDKAHIADLDAKADHGYGLLKKNATGKQERDHWSGESGKHKIETNRVVQAAASKRLGDAADKWASDLDDCHGNPYCAKNATKVYRDTVVAESKHLLAGQGETTLATQDNAQAAMIIATTRTLDRVLAGETIEATGAAGLSGIAGAGIEETQADVIARGGKPGDRTPENIIGGFSNAFTDQIKKLDKGGWVSTDPQFIPGSNDIQRDGNGDPIYAFTTHDPSELPPPGLFEVPAVTTFTDFSTPSGPATGPSGVPGPKTVMPRQFVRAEPPSIVTVNEGGDPVDPKNVGPATGLTPITAPPAGYMVVKVIGPDGNLQTLYRTGDGTATNPHLLHTEPPIAPESAGGPKMTKVNGVMTPVYTVHPGPPDKNGNPTLTYDTTALAKGVSDARNKNPNSGRYVYGTYETIGAAATAKGINDIFNKGGPNANGDATKLLKSYSDNITKLPPDQQAKSAGDLFQLGKTVELRARGITTANLDDEYGALINRTPKQDQFEKQLAGAGFTAQTYGQDEVNRRVSMLEEIDKAEGRLGASASTSNWATDKYGMMAQSQDPAWRMRQTLNNADAATIAAAKRDIFNPSISVSGIKIPGVPAMMQQPTLQEQAYAAGLQAGLPFAGPGAPGALTKPFAPPVPAGTVGKPPVGTPPGGGSTGNFAPPTPAGPGTPGANTSFTPPAAKLTPPTPAPAPTPSYTPTAYKPPPVLKDWRMMTQNGETVYVGTGPNAGRKVVY